MATYVFPTPVELSKIEQDLIPDLMGDDPIFQIMPISETKFPMRVWEQWANVTGLQAARGLGGSPVKVNALAANQYTSPPGYYGDQIAITEAELVMARQLGSFDAPMDVSDLVAVKQLQLLQRRFNRIRQISWLTLANGTYTALGAVGQILATDIFPIQTFTALVTWATVATATPLANFRAVKLLARGHSVDFGRQAKAYMNQATANNLLMNTNAADLYGRRTQGLATINSLDDLNRLLVGDDLPEIVVYDKVYIDDASANQLFIPNNRCIVVGKRYSGVAVGQFQLTRNASNPDLSARPYTEVRDSAIQGLVNMPRELVVVDGFNGGPVLQFPTSVVAMTV